VTRTVPVEPVGAQRGTEVTPAVAANIGLRGLMESGVIAAFAYWGYRSGNGAARRTLRAIAAPAVAFGVWGAVDFRQLGRLGEPARLVEELAISGLAMTALWAVRQRALAVILGATSVGHHALVYASGERLLKELPARSK
jgi:Protein of unknown function (DUF2568)